MNDYLMKLSAQRCTDSEIRNTFDMSRIFYDNSYTYNEKNLYMSRFGRIPNSIFLHDIDCKKANDWLEQNYGDAITDCCYAKRYDERKGLYFDSVYYFLFDDMLVNLKHIVFDVEFLFQKTDHVLVEGIVNEIRKFPKRKIRQKPEIELLVTTTYGLSTQSMKISKPKFSIEDNYNDDFLMVHHTILNRLRKKHDKGLVLLHGKPGTGKTSYPTLRAHPYLKKYFFQQNQSFQQ